MCTIETDFSISDTDAPGWATFVYEHDRPFEILAVIHYQGDETCWTWSLETLRQALDGAHSGFAHVQMYPAPHDSTTLIINLQDDGQGMELAFDRDTLSDFCKQIVTTPEEISSLLDDSIQRLRGDLGV